MTPKERQILSAVATVAILAGGLVWAAKHRNTPAPQTKDETANWKTYHNDEYGFEFKYPAGHELFKNDVINKLYGLEEHDIGFAIEDKHFGEMSYSDTINFAVKVGSGNPDNFLKNADGARYNEGISKGKLLKSIFAAHQAIIDNSGFISSGFLSVYVYGNNDTYFILIEQNSGKELLSQILSTFKFTK